MLEYRKWAVKSKRIALADPGFPRRRWCPPVLQRCPLNFLGKISKFFHCVKLKNNKGPWKEGMGEDPWRPNKSANEQHHAKRLLIVTTKHQVYIGYTCRQNIPALSIKPLLKFIDEIHIYRLGTVAYNNSRLHIYDFQ